MAEAQKTGRLRQVVGLWGGIILVIVLQLIGPPESLAQLTEDGIGAENAWIVLSLLGLMAVWWVSEAIPIPVTSLLPIIVLPFFGVQALRATAADYMHPIVVLLMGGFIFAKTIERWGLHKRIALNVVARVGARPTALVGGFMLASALLSMWISNTATSIMMMPIAISVALAVASEGDDMDLRFPKALILGIAYACSIGGLGTPVGTPTNLIVMGYLNDSGAYSIDFADWMLLGIPAVLVLLPIAWFVLTRWSFPVHKMRTSDSGSVVHEQVAALGKMSSAEVRTLLLFLVVAGLWVFKAPLQSISISGIAPFGGLSDQITAIFGVVLAFLIPAGRSAPKGERLLDWPSAESIPWGVLLLFGGGMSLAGAISSSGLGAWLGSELSALATLPIIVLMLIITAVVIFTTEVTSNVATAAAMTPVLGAMAVASNLDVGLVIAPLALAASCAFMLPMATGPNAVAFSSGKVSLPAMAAAGFRINLLAIPLITLIVYLLAPFAFSLAGP